MYFATTDILLYFERTETVQNNNRLAREESAIILVICNLKRTRSERDINPQTLRYSKIEVISF